ncbi:MAG: GGDEF domain-containing protein [Elusimicrobia bacterium]|nr:GGDEF domain-containing protein [Elusimicrobiota bacterium]
METLSLSLIALAPGLSLFLGFPGKRVRVLSGLGIGVLGWLFLGGSNPAFSPEIWAAFILWTFLVYGYSLYRWQMVESAVKKWTQNLEGRQKTKQEMERELSRLKHKGSQGEEDQNRALAIYGLVKSLSEALNWDAIKPKLESTMKRYLGLEEFALYISDMDSADRMQFLVRKGLLGSVGATWESLKKFLEQQEISETKSHVFSEQNAIGVPIHHSQELVGYVFAKLPTGTQPQEVLSKTQGFAEEISFALKRLRLFQEVEKLSEMDGLTGVYRRRVMEERLRDETLRARTFKTVYCFMLLDIDHFKGLNDTYGHPFGDLVLRRVGEILKSCVYETDFVARYGGEEFAVILPRAEPLGVLRKAEIIRSMVEREAFIHGLDTVHTTLSIGIAHFPRDGQTPEEVVARADQALYRAKEQGRNRTVDIGS